MFLALVTRRNIGGQPTVYRNGYYNVYRGIAPSSALNLSVTLNNVVLRVIRQNNDLRSVANSGYVESALGWDIRFEHPSFGQLKHDIDLYDPVNGVCSAWVRFPTILFNDILIVDMYFGKPGLSASEEDPQATWNGAYFVLDLATGQDLTPTGQNLIMEGVIETRMANMSAGDYAEVVLPTDTFADASGNTWATSSGDVWALS